MAARASLKNIFENPMPETSSPWGQLLPEASSASFEEFGELCHPSTSSTAANSPHTDHPPPPPPPSPRQCIDTISEPVDTAALEIFGELCYCVKSDIDAPIEASAAAKEEGRIGYMRSKSTCERSGVQKVKEAGGYMRSYSDVKQRTGAAAFPPPITTIGSGGKPRVYFKSFRKDGRFVLREIRIPTQRLLQATREDGRLTMRVMRDEDEQEKVKREREEDDGEL